MRRNSTRFIRGEKSLSRIPLFRVQRLFQAAKNFDANLSLKFFLGDFTADVPNFDDISLRLNHVQVSVGYSSKIPLFDAISKRIVVATNFSMT